MESNMSGMAGKEQGDDVHLPPGFRFHPTDEELLIHYLTPKVRDRTFSARAIAEVDLNKSEPWDLPAKAKIGETEWYFFSVRDRKYPTGLRTNRATEAGYWKATGKDREIFRKRTSTLIGMKKTLVFYAGRAPKGEKTNWVMHEYRLEGKSSYYNLAKTAKEEWVVSRVFKKNVSGAGKKCSLGLRITFQNDLDSAGLPRLLESPSLTPNAVNERTRSLESDSGSAGEHVACFSSPVEPLKDYNTANVNGFPGRSPGDRQPDALTAGPSGISEIANIMWSTPYPQARQLNDSLLNINATSGISPFCNLSRQENAARLFPHNTLHTLPSYPLGEPNVNFPACDNMKPQKHGLITPSTVFRSLVDQHEIINDTMGFKQCKELPSPFSLENNKIPRMPGHLWINELTVNSSAGSLQGMFEISPEMHATKPMVSISQDFCLRADMNCDISAVVSDSSTYYEDNGRPSSSAAAPVDLSCLLGNC